jgi:divalent metal cation (Fe/Co/Zn/Cd) transporter
VGEVRLRWIGHQMRAEATITVAGSLSLRAAHQVVVDAEHALLHAVPKLAAALIHPDPTPIGEEDPHSTLAHHARPRAA